MTGLIGIVRDLKHDNDEQVQQDLYSFKPLNKKAFLSLCNRDKVTAACELVRALKPCPCGCRVQLKVAPRQKVFLECSFCGWKTIPRNLHEMLKFAILDTDPEAQQESGD